MQTFTALRLLILIAVAVSEAFTAPAQVTLQAPATSQASNARKLTGRFLHITDMHPDPHYKPHTSIYKSCHRKNPKKKRDRAGFWGTPFEECDSPLRLTDFTLRYLDKHWSSEIDFVIWTGDNARHDEDRKIPRTTDEIYDLNRAVAKKMEKIFLNKGIPVIPSIGNNDVWPHVIFFVCDSSIPG
ncbi:hypothetical protein PILCRDRAFT_811292 [Piloderma croceum F 1598]|uniref:Calcineurin-like phosphoesterase domain-containing protein n=1 Tax=Piloderma croceum (strain F 1598) TaxID=765440 RepID=A0A0C3G3F4_PILCF|nr:hypothetical protein PILCRDRAFT_811292 [Piloderma croceum F 1598]